MYRTFSSVIEDGTRDPGAYHYYDIGLELFNLGILEDELTRSDTSLIKAVLYSYAVNRHIHDFDEVVW